MKDKNSFNEKMSEASVIYDMFQNADKSWKEYLIASMFLMDVKDDVLDEDNQLKIYNAFTGIPKEKYRALAFRAFLHAFGGADDVMKYRKEFDKIYEKLKEKRVTGNVMKETVCHIFNAYLGDDIIRAVHIIDSHMDRENRINIRSWLEKAKRRSKNNYEPFME